MCLIKEAYMLLLTSKQLGARTAVTFTKAEKCGWHFWHKVIGLAVHMSTALAIHAESSR